MQYPGCLVDPQVSGYELVGGACFVNPLMRYVVSRQAHAVIVVAVLDWEELGTFRNQ